MIKVKSALLLGMLLLMQVCTVSAETIPVEDFWKRSSFREVKISPDGRYLAATVPLENLTALVVMDLTTKKLTGSFKPQVKAHIQDFYWVNNERLLFRSAVREGRFARPFLIPAYYAMNADGTKIGTGYGDGKEPELLDTLKADDKFVLVQFRSKEGLATIGKMNVDNGTIIDTFKKPPVEAPGQFVTDNNADVRLYVTGKSYKDQKVHVRPGADWDWKVLHETKLSEQDFTFKGFSDNNVLAYFSLTEKTGPDGLYSYNLKTGEKKLVSRDDNVNPAQLLSAQPNDSVYAVRFEDGFPRYEYLDKTNPAAKELMKLQASFPDTDVYPVSSTNDGNQVIYLVSSDTIPGEYYLFDRTTQKAQHLLSRASWLDPNKMALMEPMKFKARDGLELEVFLTLPKGSNGKNLPLIINPHGGPFGPYDSWGFNNETQMLASRGYAVMQVNFRGSGNYGKDFQSKGYRQWGKIMQDDLTDATRWAIQQGIADPNRICMYGASYGGYASLMAVAKEPGLYRCAVGNVGTYDLPLQLSYSTSGGGGMNPAKAFFGDVAQDDVAQYSPARLAGQIKVPVMLMAGEKDTTCPPEQSKLMFAALQKAGVPVELKIYPGEGHGNALIENQIDFANRLVAFFDKNLKLGTATMGEMTPVK